MTPAPAHRLHALLVLAAAIAGCGGGPAVPDAGRRDHTLDQAFAAMEADPSRAVALFERAGPGAELERARLEAWSECLVRIAAAGSRWRRFLADRPPPELAERARLAVIAELIESGALDDVQRERRHLGRDRQPEVDAMLLRLGGATARPDAARRLAVADPRALREFDRSLDEAVLRSLQPRQRIDRARAWCRAGSAQRGAAELRRQNFSGSLEAERRLELARCELEAGSPLRALQTLPRAPRASADELALRARAHRDRAWQRWPEPSAHDAFTDCHETAKLFGASSAGARQQALELALECATEAGRLADALASWWALEGEGWSDERRGWLGRRLGIALARRGGSAAAVRAIGRSLPEHDRALGYWLAAGSPDPAASLAGLAAAPVPDLYATWARQASGAPDACRPDLAPAVEGTSPPSPVQRLLTAGARREAVAEWRRLRNLRAATPGEALTAADLAAKAGFPGDAIRWLRAGFPELGTVDLDSVPVNAVTAYLPLKFGAALETAAGEAGVSPWLIAALARQESLFVAHARSPRGAVGVLQLVSSTARGHARALGLALPPDLTDPAVNLRLGAHEIAHLIRRFGAIEPALAAYNGGQTRTRRWWRRQSDRHLFTEEVPVPETYNYIRRVVYLSEAYRLVYQTQWRPR